MFVKDKQKVLDYIKKNITVGAKDIIEQTKISDRTVRRILKKFIDNKIIESVGNTENTQKPNRKYKLAE